MRGAPRWTTALLALALALSGAAAGAQEPAFRWTPDGPLTAEGDPEFQPLARLPETPWISADTSAGIAYFLFETPARIERYDMAAEAWLDPIELAATPFAFDVDEDGLYVAFISSVFRFSFDGSIETDFGRTQFTVEDLETLGDFLHAFDFYYYYLWNKQTGESETLGSLHYVLGGMSAAPSQNALFGRTTNIGPTDIVVMRFDEDGDLVAVDDSPYHGDYPVAQKTWMYPGEELVADNSGIVYHTEDLTFAGSLGGELDDLAILGSTAITLRSGVLSAYSEDFLRIGVYTPDTAPDGIFTEGDTVFAFSWDGLGMNVEAIPLGVFSMPGPGAPVDPHGLSYTPDQLLFDGEDTLYLLHKGSLSVFRWSLEARDYLETIPLIESPTWMALSNENRSLYFTHAAGEITALPLATLEESPLVNSPRTPCGLATAGEYVYVCDPTGAWVSHFTYAGDGSLAHQKAWNYVSEEYIWSEVNRRMYFFRDETSPNDLLWEEVLPDGFMGTDIDSPYHDSEGFVHPIRVAPDGSVVVLGSGRIFDAISLSHIDSLPNEIGDAAWGDGTLFTLRDWGEQSQIQKWNAGYSVAAARELPGDPLGLFTTGDELLVATLVDGVPELTVLDFELNSPGFHVRKTDELDFVRPGAEVRYRIEVVNFSPTRITDAVVEDVTSPELTDVTWTCAASPDSSCTGGLQTGDVSDVVDVKAGGMLVYTVWATVAPGTPDSTLTNVATVREPGGATARGTDRTIVRPGLIFADYFESGDLSHWIDHGD